MTKKLIQKGIKQGCILAPLLFSILLSDLAQSLDPVNGHLSKFGSHLLSLLLYADDTAILSFTEVGLQQYLDAFLEYWQLNLLSINYSESKIEGFFKKMVPLQMGVLGRNLLNK